MVAMAFAAVLALRCDEGCVVVARVTAATFACGATAAVNGDGDSMAGDEG